MKSWQGHTGCPIQQLLNGAVISKTHWAHKQNFWEKISFSTKMSHGVSHLLLGPSGWLVQGQR